MRVSRSPWPWGIGIGLGVVVVANAIMIHIALSHPSAPAAADHYAESQRWSEVQAERQRAQELGWTVELRPCAQLDASGCALRLEVRDAQGEVVPGLHGRVSAQRADDVTLDRDAELAEISAGEYEGTLALARPGLYALSIRLEGGPAPWVDERRIEVGSP
ncbi:MAG: FixH family protein [Myxococcales bacterium]|nr:FixH family protein [Myxococcales bacterium]MCB9712336.1 FixH family protein [Myxococcales bacterium]